MFLNTINLIFVALIGVIIPPNYPTPEKNNESIVLYPTQS